MSSVRGGGGGAARLLNTTNLRFVTVCGLRVVFIPFDEKKYFFGECCLKKNQNAPRPEHPPVRWEKMSKCLGGIKDCKYKTFLWRLNGFPDGNNIGSAV